MFPFERSGGWRGLAKWAVPREMRSIHPADRLSNSSTTQISIGRKQRSARCFFAVDDVVAAESLGDPFRDN